MNHLVSPGDARYIINRAVNTMSNVTAKANRNDEVKLPHFPPGFPDDFKNKHQNEYASDVDLLGISL